MTKCCGNCKWFSSVTGMVNIGVCAKTFYTPTCEFESIRRDDDACDFFEERTDSPEKLVRDMLDCIHEGASDHPNDLIFDKALEFEQRAKDMGIEVE